MNLDVFLMMLLIVSALTGLFTEAVKNVLDELKKTYPSNLLAGFVATVVAILTDVGYVILAEAAFNSKMAVFLIALVLLSWLCAMVGYDKVIQAIKQFKNK